MFFRSGRNSIARGTAPATAPHTAAGRYRKVWLPWLLPSSSLTVTFHCPAGSLAASGRTSFRRPWSVARYKS